MITTFYVVFHILGASNGYRMDKVEKFDSPQKACEVVSEMGWGKMGQVLEISYVNFKDTNACCEERYTIFEGLKKACGEAPRKWGCGIPNSEVKVMNCIPAPSFRVEEAK